jgi:hypothetical protein
MAAPALSSVRRDTPDLAVLVGIAAPSLNGGRSLIAGIEVTAERLA